MYISAAPKAVRKGVVTKRRSACAPAQVSGANRQLRLSFFINALPGALQSRRLSSTCSPSSSTLSNARARGAEKRTITAYRGIPNSGVDPHFPDASAGLLERFSCSAVLLSEAFEDGPALPRMDGVKRWLVTTLPR